MGDRRIAQAADAAALVEFVCIAAHRSDTRNGEGSSLTTRGQLPAYCARGADTNHEWVRVPPTRLDDITIDRMEDRPPEPCDRRDEARQRG